jgi:hypothetical protein
MPTVPGSITREHVEAFITDLLERWKPTETRGRNPQQAEWHLGRGNWAMTQYDLGEMSDD